MDRDHKVAIILGIIAFVVVAFCFATYRQVQSDKTKQCNDIGGIRIDGICQKAKKP